MKTIWKYKLEVVDNQIIPMPKDAQILTVQTQNGTPNIWALVEPGNIIENRAFVIRGTGHEFGLIDYKYIGTFQISGGQLVFHLFESGL